MSDYYEPRRLDWEEHTADINSGGSFGGCVASMNIRSRNRPRCFDLSSSGTSTTQVRSERERERIEESRRILCLFPVVVVVDSHIQRIVLATEETTVTQQVSHRPIKRQSRLWSQRGTKVNGSHHGDNPLLRPTGIQIATKSYAALQAMAPTNIKTVHQTSLLHSRATSIDSECCRLPTTSVLSKKPEKLRSNQF